MLRKFSLSFLLVLATVLPVHAETTQWVNIGSSENGSQLDIDVNSVQTSGSLVGYLSRMRYSQPDKKGTVITVSRGIMDCNSGTFQIQEFIAINRQRKIISHEQYNNVPIEQVRVGTLGNTTYSFLCQAQESIAEYPRGDSYVDIANSVNEAMKTISNATYLSR
ncbi:hypothetical protein [Nostoc sp. NMS4]|uniref:hypothetical protein n=1 Tax=Nostoc sp. NMS4 TaxID=2815390 RepID=UPI0025FF50EB|nr:hypothetical protein [Nostoc sp. NMS4]MBN3924383.1 hypothetical protein [Nostoc sp. NMS4]